MELNCSKSGIIFLENDDLVGTFFKGFPVVKEYKYLGYIVNRQLNPSPQIKEIKEKCRKITAALFVLTKEGLSVRARRYLHNLLIKPHFHYGIIFLYFIKKTHYNKWLFAYAKASKTFFGYKRTLGDSYDNTLWNHLDFNEIISQEL